MKLIIASFPLKIAVVTPKLLFEIPLVVHILSHVITWFLCYHMIYMLSQFLILVLW